MASRRPRRSRTADRAHVRANTRTTRHRTRARPPRATGAGAALDRLVRIMATLRSPTRGCAWDLKQTHESLRPYLIEETYEAVETIDRGDLAALPGELGDVLLQCVFHAQLGAEAGRFDIRDVVEAITAKLIRRHPHVFEADGTPLSAAARRRAGIDTPAAVREQWQQLKAREQTSSGAAERTLAGLPSSLPALLRASKIGARVAAVGFDWPTVDGVLDKIDEEVRELREALAQGHARRVDELGDVLFSIANLARRLQIEPETALRQANDKFTRRFDALEADFASRGRRVQDAALDELEDVWRRVKAAEPRSAPATAGPATSARESRGRRSRR
jgi:ATP diphosphatase